MTITPVFLFSLPRSGSTLTQRVLAAHSGVATTAEPWILLPLLSPLDPEIAVSRPWDRTVAGAIEDFVSSLPSGVAGYQAEVRAMTMRLYESVSDPEARFFVDKSPPYHLIADQIVETFPEARFVFLWRNPLSILTSIVDTLADGHWNVYQFRGTLFNGIENLTAAYQRHSNGVHAVRFEDLLTDESAWIDLCEYIGMKFEPASLARFANIRLEGRMGDPTGVKRYNSLSDEPMYRWRGTIHNPLRRAWTGRWLRWIGRERLSMMGYDLDALLADLAATPVGRRSMIADASELGLAGMREGVRSGLPGDRLHSSWRALLSSSSKPR